MPAQTQCPYCGGFKTSSSGTVIDRLSGRSVATAGQCVSFLAMAATCLALEGYVAVSRLEIIVSDRVSYLVMFGVFSMLLVAMALLCRSRYSLPHLRVTRQHNACLLCGHVWTQLSSDPVPSVQVRPDLIAAGETRARIASEGRHRGDVGTHFWESSNTGMDI